MEKHISVLKEELVSNLNIKADGIYIDCTLGFGGHSSEILKKLSTGHLYAFDKDINAIEYSNSFLTSINDRFTLFNESFDNLKQRCEDLNIKPDGILFDLGVSSVEIDDPDRGFSYMHDGPLDMRMDQSSSLTAEIVVNEYKKEDLVRIFREYGEERHAQKIVEEIIKIREEERISRTIDLVRIIDRCYPYREKRNSHPAKKVFQALRIEVNNELNEFKNTLIDALEILNPGGRICVITFHSLEDRICKNIFKQYTDIDPVVKGMPNIPDNMLPDYKLITRSPIIPTDKEMKVNSRSKSAKLRVIERIK